MIVLWWTVNTEATDGSDEVLRVSSCIRDSTQANADRFVDGDENTGVIFRGRISWGEFEIYHKG